MSDSAVPEKIMHDGGILISNYFYNSIYNLDHHSLKHDKSHDPMMNIDHDAIEEMMTNVMDINTYQSIMIDTDSY